ncbi:TlyA family RNA methyltransferase [Puniceicoccales bacterium CK1056]|uniref:TlyA family RNA methyltransferase n=1 Tax=Oceanipulchritudo coccoides TaxID=2706888 RepID=A0A6B2M5A7_9BACT|nr:TlyA family RNA methyltransferase [Oceanipulchritudo coccoides]NDV63304.1 TlyA family RNA methyltransferase [Oceanipulchritudo coccoides]
MAKRRVRLDELLLQRGLADSRSQAKALIMSGKVRQGTQILDKAGKEYPVDLDLQIESPPRFVSRGADKLEGFFKTFPLEVSGMRFLDVGASTGGFTDFLLQSGAIEATCVDVGHGQLHYKLRTDDRVINLERVNARHLKPAQLPHPSYPLIVMDLSFISLKLILPVVWDFLEPGGRLISLIKPQFEAGKAEADRFKGVITDPVIRERILHEILDFAASDLPNSELIGWCESPISGMNGNLEYLAGWTRNPA